MRRGGGERESEKGGIRERKRRVFYLLNVAEKLHKKLQRDGTKGNVGQGHKLKGRRGKGEGGRREKGEERRRKREGEREGKNE